jgi:CRP/FNR family cyclic AMP-dependent transcriptional regulator
VPTIADELATIELFGEVERSVVESLARHAVVRRLASGQVLFVAGDPSDHLVVVRSGRLRVLVSSERGDELVLTVLGAGEALGELSVIDGLPRSATVEALGATVLVLIPAAQVRDVLTASPAALLAVTVQLAAQVRRLTGGTADLVFLDLPRRLAKFVLTRAEPDLDGRSVVDLGVSQSGLAAQLGTTRQSVNRALAGLVRRGWVRVDGTRITVDDDAALQRFCGAV